MLFTSSELTKGNAMGKWRLITVLLATAGSLLVPSVASAASPALPWQASSTAQAHSAVGVDLSWMYDSSLIDGSGRKFG